MKKLVTLAIAALCTFALQAQYGGITYDWAKKLGQSTGTGNDNVRGMVVSNGYVYIVGGFQATVDFDPGAGTANLVSAGSNDIYFAKYTTAGDYVWAKRIGGTGDDYGLSLVLGQNDTVVIAGYFSAGGAIDFDPGANTNSLSSAGGPEGFVAKYDSAGNYVWARRVTGTGSDYTYGVTMDANDNIFITGTLGSTTTTFEHPVSPAVTLTATDPADIYFAKYNYAGHCQYARLFAGGATADVVGRDIAVDAAGDVYITGQFIGTCDFNAGAGTANLTASVNTDVFLAKYTNDGTYTWVKAMGGTTTTPNQYDNAYSLDITPSGNVIVSGGFWGTGSFNGQQVTAQGSTIAGFFASYTPAGVCNWVKAISGTGTSNQAQIYRTKHDVDGNLYVTGRFIGNAVDFDGSAAFYNIASVPGSANDIFLAKYDSSGNFVWVNSMGSSTSDEAFVMDIDASSNIYLGGYFSGTADFDPGSGTQSVVASAGNDGFIARYIPCALPAASASITGLDTVCLSLSGSVYTAAPVAGATSYIWTLPAGWSGSSTTNTIAVTSNTTSGTISVKALNSCGPSPSTSKAITLVPGPSAAPTAITGGISSPCVGGVYSYTASGGTGGSYYVWNIPAGATILSGADSVTITLQMPYTTGATSISVARANNCDTTTFATRSLTITGIADGSISPSSPTVCAGSSVTLTASVFSPNTYTWSNSLGAGASKTVSPANTTTYTVTMTTTSGLCADVDTVTVTVVPAVTASISPATVTICAGGSATLTASGGTTYAWSNSGGSNASATFSPTTNTTYTVTVSDGNCSATASRLVSVNANPTVGITPATSTICAGGSATLTATGGGTYAWSNSGGSNAAATFSPTTTTTYTVTVTNANNCTASASRTVNVNALPQAAIAPSATAICAGGSATLTASGGGTYAWSNSGGSNAAATYSPTSTTTYTVTVTNANNCSATATATITVNQLPTAAIQPATVTICNGQSATLTASGGTTYAWSNSGGSNAQATFSPATNTTYTVTVTDGNNCSATASKLVTVNSNPTAVVQPATTTVCAGNTATLTASGGTAYAWSNSGGSNAAATFSPSSTTTYTVTVTNANNCSATATATITVNQLPTAGIQPATVTICNGQSATLTASGGTTYAWSNSGGSNAQATFSPTGTTTYTVTVTDGNNCSATASRLVTVNSLPTATVTPSATAVCEGSSATLTAGGGTAYAWSNSGGSNAAATFSPSSTTTYTVTVTNANNCSATASGTITINPIPAAAINGPTTICSGLSATLTASGGGTYAWGNGLGSNAAITVTPTTTTTYSVTVTGAGNCTATTSQTVSVQSSPTATISGPTALCIGDSITLTANGGNTYAWSNGAATSSIKISPATATTYSVTVSIGANCTATATQSVAVNTLPTAAIQPAATTICEGNSATLTASGNGNYSWSNSGGSNAAATFSPTSTTTYTVTVTNANNCTATASAIVTVNSNPTAAVNPSGAAVCAGGSTTLTAGGGAQYTWSNNATTAQINVTPANTITYTVTVTNAANCTATASATVTVNPIPAAAISGDNAICAGGTATLTATGGGTYQWSNNGGSNAQAVFTPAATTTYTVTVTGTGNCTATANQAVTVTTVTAAINGPTTLCSGLSATLTASGGGSYVWSTTETTAAITVTPVSATTYTVTVTNNNCTATASQTVSVQNAPTATISGSTTVCAGESVQLTANGGNTYTWSNNLGTGASVSVSPTATTTYTVTASLGANCTASASHTVSILQPTASAISQTICNGEQFIFDGNTLTASGTYTQTLVNAAGCDSVVTLTLTVLAPVTSAYTESICTGSSYDFNGEILTQAGTYYDTLTSVQSCDSVVQLTLVILAPITSSYSGSICAGGTYDFNGEILTQPGTYYDTLTSVQSCDSIVELNLLLADTPQITQQPTVNNATVCAGATVTLNVSATGNGLSYQWKESGAAEGPDADTYTTAALSAGAKSYRVEVSNNCGTVVSDAVVVTVNALPVPVITQTGAVLSTQAFSQYQWQLGGTDINGANAQSYTAVANGDYTVAVVDANGCEATSSAVNVTGVGIAEEEEMTISVYPNPAVDVLIVQTQLSISSIEIYSVAGTKVLAAEGNLRLLDVSTLAQGNYTIKLVTLQGNTVLKRFAKM
jgi:hypothetical protein